MTGPPRRKKLKLERKTTQDCKMSTQINGKYAHNQWFKWQNYWKAVKNLCRDFTIYRNAYLMWKSTCYLLKVYRHTIVHYASSVIFQVFNFNSVGQGRFYLNPSAPDKTKFGEFPSLKSNCQGLVWRRTYPNSSNLSQTESL